MKRFSIFLQSVRFRLTLWYVGILALVILIFGALVYFVLSGSLHSGMDDLLRARSNQVAASYNITDGQLNLQEQDENGPVLPAEGEVLLLIDPHGQIVQKAGHLSTVDTDGLVKMAVSIGVPNQEYFSNFNLAPFARSANDLGNQLDYRFFVTTIVDSGQVAGILVLGRSLESTESIVQNLLLVLIIAAPVALLTSALGGYWLATRAMRPVRTITLAAHQMSESDLSKRFNFKRKDEMGELAATFDQLFARLENAFNRQRQFTADASHELRTPLSIVRLEADQALVGAPTKEDYQQALTTIKSESEHMARLVNDMLMLARADAGRAALKRETIDLSEVVLEVVERLKPLAEQHGVSLKMVGGELPELLIKGDSSYLSQMLINLVENAIKFTAINKNLTPSKALDLSAEMPAGGEVFEDKPLKKWVRLEVGQYGKEWAWVRVQDNGPGIAASHLPHLFDRFYQVDPARSNSNYTGVLKFEAGDEPVEAGIPALPGGSGLGLAIVKWVIETHNGQIKVESPLNPDQSGACFEVQLPLFIY